MVLLLERRRVRGEGVLGGGVVGVGGLALDRGQEACVAEVGAFLPVHTRATGALVFWKGGIGLV